MSLSYPDRTAGFPRPSTDCIPQIWPIQIEPGFISALLNGGEKGRFLVLLEAFLVSLHACCQQELSAGGNLDAFVPDVVLVEMAHKTQIDPRSPDILAGLIVGQVPVGDVASVLLLKKKIPPPRPGNDNGAFFPQGASEIVAAPPAGCRYTRPAAYGWCLTSLQEEETASRVRS